MVSHYDTIFIENHMPSERKYIPFRPDDRETVILSKLTEKRGLSASRLLGTAIREMAERDNISVSNEEIEEARIAREERIKKT